MTDFSYWPLGEPSGSTTAGNIAPARSDNLTVTQIGSGGTLEFGGTGLWTTPLTAPVFTPASAGNGKLLSTAFSTPVTHNPGEVLDLEVFLKTTTAAQAVLRMAYGTRAADGAYTGLQLEIDSTGHPRLTGRNGPGSVSATSTATVTDGAFHHVSVRLSLVGGNLTPSLMVDGASRVAGTAGSGEFLGVPIEYRTVTLGGVAPTLLGSGVTMDLFSGTLAHLAVYQTATGLADARITDHALAGLTGFEGERSDQRIRRYARYARIPDAELNV